MTAQWESTLEAISKKRSSYSVFMDPLSESLHALIRQSKSVLPDQLKGLKSSKKKFKKHRKRKPKIVD
jgi:DNA topoisomerase-3